MMYCGRGGKIGLVVDDKDRRMGKHCGDTFEKMLLFNEGIATGLRGIKEKENNICQMCQGGDGLAFMPAPPDVYYEKVDARLPGHGEPLERMQANGILVDGDVVTLGPPSSSDAVNWVWPRSAFMAGSAKAYRTSGSYATEPRRSSRTASRARSTRAVAALSRGFPAQCRRSTRYPML